MLKRYHVAGLLAALLIAMGLAGHQDYEEQVRHEQMYCDMVATWKAEAKAGVPVNDRTGWPPYDGECK